LRVSESRLHNLKRWRREQIDQLLTGPFAEATQTLIDFLTTMALAGDQAKSLIELVQSGPWQNADDDSRFTILNLINERIVALREEKGLPPFDDPINTQSRNVSVILRELLRNSR
jgi:hypothetical protein